MSSTYSLSGDSHMIKNMEWGAIAYLKQSKYGLGTTDIVINSDSNYYTGGGSGNSYKNNIGQSTTGNVYGVYDMSGNGFEYVMGNMADSSSIFYISNSEFSGAPDAKYYDAYTYGTSNAEYSRGKLGDSTKEVLSTHGSITGGWYDDYAIFPLEHYSWFMRGGDNGNGINGGIFTFNGYSGAEGGNNSTRAIITP